MVITIQNQVNQTDKPIRISFRRKDQLSGDVIWRVLERVSQSNSVFNALDTCRNYSFGQNGCRVWSRYQNQGQADLSWQTSKKLSWS